MLDSVNYFFVSNSSFFYFSLLSNEVCLYFKSFATLIRQFCNNHIIGCNKVVFNFEDGPASLKDWGRTGTAFNNQPTYGDNVKARRKDQVANNQGDYWIGTYENRPDNSTPPGSRSGDFPQGSMISPEFQITGFVF